MLSTTRENWAKAKNPRAATGGDDCACGGIHGYLRSLLRRIHVWRGGRTQCGSERRFRVEVHEGWPALNGNGIRNWCFARRSGARCDRLRSQMSPAPHGFELLISIGARSAHSKELCVVEYHHSRYHCSYSQFPSQGNLKIPLQIHSSPHMCQTY